MFLPLHDDTPRLRAPFVTLALVAASVIVFVYQLTLSPAEMLTFVHRAGVIPWEIRHLTDLVGTTQPRDLVPPPFTIFTSLFLHGDLPHLLGNMWFLWVFGSRLEGYMGQLRYIAFYFLVGAIAAVLQVAVAPTSTLPMIGASGAISGVLGAYALTFPRARIRCLLFVFVFVTFIALPASALLVLWFLGQLTAAGHGSPGIAWFAHVGGFLSGAALARGFVGTSRSRRLVYRVPSWPHRVIPRSIDRLAEETASW